MRLKIKLEAKNIDSAAEEIIGVLEDASKGNMIYFKGWGGFGASALLNLVAQRLKSLATLNKFAKVIHVDCSVWKNMRALQKAVGEELELPQSVMAIFERCDQEDDFNGIEEGSRGVIAEISREICRKLLSSKFVLIFHNGSRSYIDLYECGVPVISLLGNKVLWTWHVRFRYCAYLILEDGEKGKMKSQSDILLSASPNNVELPELLDLVRDLLHEDALEVAKCAGIVQPDDMSHKIVMECLIYRTLIAMDLKTHAPNYWVCDGIIQDQDNASAWEIGNSLERNMSSYWNFPYNEDTASVLQVSDDFLVNRWNFTTHEQLLKDYTRVLPPQVTSFFLSEDEPPTNTTSILPVRMFQYSQSSKLRVLHLSHCIFSFASPPFLCCSQLRLLHLDHCKNITHDHEHPSHSENMPCFQKLWVLDLRYTNWYWLLSEKMKRVMVELRELNVEGVKHGSISDLCGGRPSLVILRVTADPVPTEKKDTTIQAQFPNVFTSNSLTTSSFINDVLPPCLKSFTFINKAATVAKIFSISFRGSSLLKNILLRGNLGSLEELDLSGTAVKTLDLREVEAPILKRIILMSCGKLRAILWPPKDKGTWVLQKLHISTVQSASPNQNNWEEKTQEATTAAGSPSILTFGAQPQGIGQAASFQFNFYICVVDPRLMRSLVPFERHIVKHSVYMEIDSSPTATCGAAAGGRDVSQGMGSQQQVAQYLYARDVFQEHPQLVGAIEGVISWMWACPPIPIPSPQDWYFHMQDEEKMERARPPLAFHAHQIQTGTALNGAVLRDCCPRLRHVLPLPASMNHYISPLPSLETLEIVCCSDLKEIFPLEPKRQENQQIVYFANLRRIHLYELPMLHHICGSRMFAPKLETVKIRGCWSLRILPAVSGDTSKRPKVDCEKEWWDNLEWLNWLGCYSDERKGCYSDQSWAEIKHDPSLYELSHSRYYKKADLPRGTVLR
ncbi:uncharacterized protein LOC123424947 [Hordeum vulgare subsp. vulgare]|uniref:uncharacterized protein LOC123424947 n=1 Tax=Hordeum vulgare subsp. vulgare TaxID=112509 RepID=UPI001D1A454B|nr:uncharacterized protein LOC123424947 [Hordeum vulgare subsp. vulgare]